ncbi:MAG: hypothetical protein IJ935_20780 [Afipia sp.]|nr:hypothetical protein [Afipia sp.]
MTALRKPLAIAQPSGGGASQGSGAIALARGLCGNGGTKTSAVRQS